MTSERILVAWPLYLQNKYCLIDCLAWCTHPQVEKYWLHIFQFCKKCSFQRNNQIENHFYHNNLSLKIPIAKLPASSRIFDESILFLQDCLSHDQDTPTNSFPFVFAHKLACISKDKSWWVWRESSQSSHMLLVNIDRTRKTWWITVGGLAGFPWSKLGSRRSKWLLKLAVFKITMLDGP